MSPSECLRVERHPPLSSSPGLPLGRAAKLRAEASACGSRTLANHATHLPMTAIETPRAARWSCQQCGQCCHNFELGPVEPEIIEGLKQRGVEQDWAPAAELGWYTVRSAGPKQTYFLHKRSDTGACVFLRKDRLCAIHSLYGEAAKPGFCRAFPFALTRTPSGVVAVARPSCGGFFQAIETGESFASQVDSVAALPGLEHPREFAPDPMVVLPGPAGFGLPLDRWMPLEKALRQTIFELDEEPTVLLAHIRTQVFESAGQPVVQPDPRRYRMALQALSYTIALVLEQTHPTDGSVTPAIAALGARLAKIITTAQGRLAHPPPPLDPAARRYLNLLLRSQLLGKTFYQQGSLAAGLGLFLFNVTVAQRAARWPASGPVSAAALSAVLSPWSRLTLNRSLDPILARARPALIDLFLHMGAPRNTA